MALPSPGFRAGAAAGARAAFARDVRRDLTRAPKRLEARYLYDALGSRLFGAISCLPWYRITRAESRLLARHAGAAVRAVGDVAVLVDLGCGSGEKTARLARAAAAGGLPVTVSLIDVSSEALRRSALALRPLERVSAVRRRATYERGLRRMAAARHGPGSALALFLGSNIGNLDPRAARAFLRRIRAALRPGDGLLLGADLVKPEAELLAAYDDPLGVTAAFNKNLLLRMNRELGAGFDLAAFDHRAAWNAEASRVEMHLVSRRRQEVPIPGAAFTVSLDRGETIWTESSYKYRPAEVTAMGERCGFRRLEQWVDPRARFALALFLAT